MLNLQYPDNATYKQTVKCHSILDAIFHLSIYNHISFLAILVNSQLNSECRIQKGIMTESVSEGSEGSECMKKRIIEKLCFISYKK